MIVYVMQSLFGRTELWAVQLDGPRTGWGEPAYRALFAVASGEIPGRVSPCELGHTPLHAKEPIARERAAELHPELVRRAEADLITADELPIPAEATEDERGDA